MEVLAEVMAVPMERVERRIAKLISHADLDIVTAKMIRKQIEAKYDVSLAEHKKVIDNLIVLQVQTPPVEAKKSTFASKKSKEVDAPEQSRTANRTKQGVEARSRKSALHEQEESLREIIRKCDSDYYLPSRWAHILLRAQSHVATGVLCSTSSGR